MVIDESGYGRMARRRHLFSRAFIGEVHQWEDFADYWEPIMNEMRPWTAQTLKRNRGKNDHPRILRLVKAIADSGIARNQFRIPHEWF